MSTFEWKNQAKTIWNFNLWLTVWRNSKKERKLLKVSSFTRNWNWRLQQEIEIFDMHLVFVYKINIYIASLRKINISTKISKSSSCGLWCVLEGSNKTLFLEKKEEQRKLMKFLQHAPHSNRQCTAQTNNRLAGEILWRWWRADESKFLEEKEMCRYNKTQQRVRWSESSAQ